MSYLGSQGPLGEASSPQTQGLEFVHPFTPPHQAQTSMNSSGMGNMGNFLDSTGYSAEMGETHTAGISAEASYDAATLPTALAPEGPEAAAALEELELQGSMEVKAAAKPPSKGSPGLRLAIGVALLVGLGAAAAAAAAAARSLRRAVPASQMPLEVSAGNLSALSLSVHEHFAQLAERWHSSSHATQVAFCRWYYPKKRGIVVVQDPIDIFKEHLRAFDSLKQPTDTDDFNARRTYAVQCLLMCAVMNAACMRLSQLESTYERWQKDPTYSVNVLDLPGAFLNYAELNATPGTVSFQDFSRRLTEAGFEGLSASAADAEQPQIPPALATRLEHQAMEDVFMKKEDKKVFSVFHDFHTKVQRTLLAHDSPYKPQDPAANAPVQEPLSEIPMFSTASPFSVQVFKQALEEAEKTFDNEVSPQEVQSWEQMWTVGGIASVLRQLDDKSIRDLVRAQKLVQQYAEVAGTATGAGYDGLGILETALSLL